MEMTSKVNSKPAARVIWIEWESIRGPRPCRCETAEPLEELEEILFS